MSTFTVLNPATEEPVATVAQAAAAGLPDGVFQVLPGRGAVAGQRLVEHETVRKIVFTGSTEAGRQFMAGCARHRAGRED